VKRVVFDCNVYAKALINIRGPEGACIEMVRAGLLILFVSDYVLQEIRELPAKIPAKYGVTAERVDSFIGNLVRYASLVDKVPSVYVHPVDPDDSHYVDLAVMTGSTLVVSNDRHLLALMDLSLELGIAFRQSFPAIEVLTPHALLMQLRAAGP
jgi:putative PIN family toxin of toxin-antitoxin system